MWLIGPVVYIVITGSMEWVETAAAAAAVWIYFPLR
jgi:hypothetical protein